jgi:hypothetical protein
MAQCKSEGCYKNSAKGKNYCHSCIIERFKTKNPEKYAYFVLKNNAKRRRKVFSISFEYFLKFCKKHDYIQRRGITKQGLHIDRKEEHLGYIEGNLQVLTNTENVKKIRKFEAGRHYVIITNKQDNETHPF